MQVEPVSGVLGQADVSKILDKAEKARQGSSLLCPTVSEGDKRF